MRKSYFKKYFEIVIIILMAIIFLITSLSNLYASSDKIKYSKWQQGDRAHSYEVRLVTVERGEYKTKKKYIGPGKRGTYLQKGESLSYIPRSGKNPVSVSVGAGISIPAGIASGSISCSISVPVGSIDGKGATVNCKPVKEKGYYGLVVWKTVKPTLFYSQTRTWNKSKGRWVVHKAELLKSLTKYEVVHNYHEYRRFNN